MVRRWWGGLATLILLGLLPACSSASPEPGPLASSCSIPAPLATASSAPRLSGPAVAALASGRATHSFSLDDAAFQMAPPGSAHPTITREQAECAAMAATDMAGYSLGLWAQESGFALGYGRVTISSTLTSHPANNPVGVAGGTEGVPEAARLPPVTSYRSRLAWVFAVLAQEPTNCPAETAPPVVKQRRSDYGYQLLILDARRGDGALVYSEGGPLPCGGAGRVAPAVSQPVEQVSVPWRLRDRTRDGYAGHIWVQVESCDGYSRSVNVQEGGSLVRFVVQRPIGVDCRPSRWVSILLQSATVIVKLPITLTHAELGPYIASAVSPGPVSHSSSTGEVQTITASENGRTLDAKVGDVLEVLPLGASQLEAVNPTQTSDPAVLARIENGALVAAFRAVGLGRADLLVPASQCPSPASAGSCPFRVHVVVGPAGAEVPPVSLLNIKGLLLTQSPGGPYQYLAPGTAEPSSNIGQRSAQYSGVVYGLADEGSLFGASWPAISRNNGASWAIDGPQMWRAAAQGAAYVDHITSYSPYDVAAWGGALWVTSDAGAHWYGGVIGEGVVTLGYANGAFTAEVLPVTGDVDWIYASQDGGQTWSFSRFGQTTES